MSFGRPPSFSTFQPTPPDKGAFPLDHDAECKDTMIQYMSCLRQNSNKSTTCRGASKSYLECRMTKGLMQKEEWSSLGMHQVAEPSASVNKDSP